MMKITEELLKTFPAGRLFNADSKDYGFMVPFVVSLEGDPLCFGSDHIVDANAFVKHSIESGKCSPIGWNILHNHFVESSLLWEGSVEVVKYNLAEDTFTTI